MTGVAHRRAEGVVQHREQEVHRMCRQHEEQQHIRIEDDVFEWVHARHHSPTLTFLWCHERTRV